MLENGKLNNADAIESLKAYKKRVEPILKAYFNRKMKQAGKVDPLGEEAVKIIADFTLAGGKRLRPALVYYGFRAAGGRDGEEILEASMAIELLHTFLLIHDDIIDRDEKRHGVMTVHERYREIGRAMAPRKDSAHFGNSMAIMAGDMAHAMGSEIMFNAKFSPEIIIKALDKLQIIVNLIVPGEMLDVVLENRGHATEAEILRMYEGKTSSYSFEGPLHLGAVLAGGSSEMTGAFTRYSLPLGKAFQLRDDVLGLFGDEKKLGKPVGSDVIEGKQTILLIKALENGTKAQRALIKSYLGKKDLTGGELNEFRKVIIDTKAKEYCQNLAEKFVAEALDAIDQLEFKDNEARLFLTGLAEYMIQRDA